MRYSFNKNGAVVLTEPKIIENILDIQRIKKEQEDNKQMKREVRIHNKRNKEQNQENMNPNISNTNHHPNNPKLTALVGKNKEIKVRFSL